MNELNIFRRFSKSAEKDKNKEIILYKNDDSYDSLNYKFILDKSIQFGNCLKNLGVVPGDKVVILLENRPEFSYVFMGIMYAKGTSVGIDNQFPPDQIKFLLSHSNAKVLVTSNNLYENIKKHIKDIEVILIDSDDFGQQLNLASRADAFNESTLENNLAVLFYTSGSTDNPKGVMLSHVNLLSNVDSILKTNIASNEDIIISLLPLHHAFSFTVTFLMPLLIGARIAYPASLSSVDLLSCIKDNNVTLFTAVPQVYKLIHGSIIKKIASLDPIKRLIAKKASTFNEYMRNVFNINLGKSLFKEIHKNFGSHLKYLVSGGARLDTNIATDFFKWGFTMLEGYGLTETSPVATFNPQQKPIIGSVGKAIPAVEIKIVDPDETAIGEVAIKGPNVMLGYYNNPEETHKMIKNGWLHSGDLGFIDEEGYLFLSGRKKEMIVLSSGKNLNPEDIEKHYSQCPYIKEICVLSINDSDQKNETEKLMGIIVIDEDHYKSKNKTRIQEKLKFELDTLSAKLPSYQRIKGFIIYRDELPRTRLGKIQRYKMKELYHRSIKEEKEKINATTKKNFDRKTQGVPNKRSTLLEKFLDIKKIKRNKEESSESLISKTVLILIEQTLNKSVHFTDHLELDLGLDSLQTVELLLSLKQRLNLTISDEKMSDFLKCRTIEELIQELKKNLPKNFDQDLVTEKRLDWGKLIKEIPSSENLNKIRINFGFWLKCGNFFIVVFLKMLFKILFLMRVEGKGNLKTEGSFIISPNHTSYLDGLIITAAMPLKIIMNCYFVGISEIFESAFLKHFIKGTRLIPIDVNINPTEALKSCSFVLRNSKIVCLFPEGVRSIDGKVTNFKKGIGILISELDVGVVPAIIEGAYESWPRGQKFPKLAPIKVKFGKMLTMNDLFEETINRDERYQLIADNLRNKVISLQKSIEND